MVTREEVVYAFRLILGREPENDAVVENLLKVQDWAALRALFFESNEFRIKNPSADRPSNASEFILWPPDEVDVEINQDNFDRLVGHVQRAWEQLGTEKPHWSVLVEPQFLPDLIEKNSENFYKTGGDSFRLLGAAAARAGVQLPDDGSCFELGCGVGRVTAHLARHFKHITACDISQPHLDIARRYMEEKSITNVNFTRLSSMSDFSNVEPVDLFFSVIVLQHNPPPLIYDMLRRILEKVNSRGLVYYQVPVHNYTYKFHIDEYFAAVDRGERHMEMHILPQKYYFKVLSDAGFQILDLQRDNWAGPEYASYSVLAQKK